MAKKTKGPPPPPCLKYPLNRLFPPLANSNIFLQKFPNLNPLKKRLGNCNPRVFLEKSNWPKKKIGFFILIPRNLKQDHGLATTKKGQKVIRP